MVELSVTLDVYVLFQEPCVNPQSPGTSKDAHVVYLVYLGSFPGIRETTSIHEPLCLSGFSSGWDHHGFLGFKENNITCLRMAHLFHWFQSGEGKKGIDRA